MIGLCGANGTGKSTLAQAFAQEQDIPFVATSASEVFRKLDLDPAADYPLDIRLAVQEAILSTFEAQYAAATKLSPLWIADRTPIDLASYMIADVQRRSLVEEPELAAKVNDYVARCLKSASRHFSVIMLVQPGIKVEMNREGKAPSCAAYMEHLNSIQLGLLCDERSSIRRYSLPRSIITPQGRMQALVRAVAGAIEAEKVLRKSRTVH